MMHRFGFERVTLCLTLLIVASGLMACGEAQRKAFGSREHRASQPTDAKRVLVLHGALNGDGDIDGSRATSGEHTGTGADTDGDSTGNTYYDWDDGNVLDYGHAASVADSRAIAAVIGRYYAAAAAGDGSAVCGLASSRMRRVVVDEYGHSSGLPALRGRSCRIVMGKVLADLHEQMNVDRAALHLGIVRVNGSTAEAMVGLRASWPENYLVLRHERGRWRVAELLATELP